jgi:hypothetical protein
VLFELFALQLLRFLRDLAGEDQTVSKELGGT